MSQATQPATQAPQAYDPDTAYAVIHQRVYVPAFFEKLANDYGWRPKNQQESQQALQMAAQLREAFDAEQEKAAAANNPLNRAQQHLDTVLQQAGYANSQPTSQQLYIKQAAAHGSFDPQIATAVLSLQASELQAGEAQQPQQPQQAQQV